MNIFKSKNNGFTIIELIVFIAIIAVLAGIVLVNVTQYINRARNVAIKAGLDGVLKQSAIYYSSNNGSYVGFCPDPTTKSMLLSIKNAYTTSGTINEKCHCNFNGWAGWQGITINACRGGINGLGEANSTTFCACSPLLVTDIDPPDSTYCVDSTGYKKETLVSCDSRCQGYPGFCQ